MNWIRERIVSMQTPKPHPGRAFKVCTSVFIFFLPAVAVSAQTNSPPAEKDNSVYAELAKAPTKAAARRNPLAADPDAVAAGGKLFDLHCAECHGQMAEGGRKGPSLRADEVQQASPGSLFWLLTNGVVRRGMPVWSKLPEPQRWQLVSFIKSLGPAMQPISGGEKTPHP
jgi:mono/diheme cytochrome c family protein